MLFAATDWPTLASLSVTIGDSHGLQVWYVDMDAETGAFAEKLAKKTKIKEHLMTADGGDYGGERLTDSRPLWQSSRCSKRSRPRSLGCKSAPCRHDFAKPRRSSSRS